MLFQVAFTLVFVVLGSGTFSQAQAEPIEVLISIQKERVSKRLEHKVTRQLEKKGFNKSEYRIRENADQYLLHQTLMNTETKALIWISHGATARMTRKMKRSSTNAGGMSAIPELIDYRGDNVAPVFKNYSTSLKFISIIGCNSKQILDYVQSGISNDDEIIKLIPDRKIIAQHAIRKTITTLANQKINNDTNHTGSDQTEASTHLTIKRFIPISTVKQSIRSLRVMNGSELLGVIPVVEPGETKTFRINVKNTMIRQIQLESGQKILTPSHQIEFGELEVGLTEGKVFQLFTKNDGTPFGVNFRVFLLK